MPALDQGAPSLVPLPAYDPARARARRAARLARMAAGAKADPPVRPVLIRIPEPRPIVERDPSVRGWRADGTVTYRQPHGPPTRGQALAPRRILVVVAEHYGVRVDAIRATRRDAEVIPARQMAVWVIRDVRGLSYPEIGRVLGGRDHTTALHSVRKVDAAIKRGDAETLAAIAAVRARLGITGEG